MTPRELKLGEFGAGQRVTKRQPWQTPPELEAEGESAPELCGWPIPSRPRGGWESPAPLRVAWETRPEPEGWPIPSLPDGARDPWPLRGKVGTESRPERAGWRFSAPR